MRDVIRSAVAWMFRSRYKDDRRPAACNKPNVARVDRRAVHMGNYGFGFHRSAAKFRGRAKIRKRQGKYNRVQRTKPLRYWTPLAWSNEHS